MRSTLLLVFTLVSLSACGDIGSGSSGWLNSIAGGDEQHPEWPICSVLPFDEELNWPIGEVGIRRSAFKLSLNISSSYEGRHGWSSIANDFDGMGLSLGLLNQPLGVGSLQPLLIKMRNQHYGVLSSIFPAAHLSSLTGMLKTWEGRASSSVLANEQTLLSPLDIYGEDEVASRPVSPFAARDAASAAWARSTLYTDGGRTFKQDWLRELQSMAETPEYVAIQIAAANSLHQYALQLYETIGITTARSYLLMFDFVVQNGGLYNSDINMYFNWYNANPNATEKQRLYKILEIRLRHVNPKYVEDVKARKGTIIEGTGYVHGSHRQLESEYCYNSAWSDL